MYQLNYLKYETDIFMVSYEKKPKHELSIKNANNFFC